MVSIRKNIKKNFKGASFDEIKTSIEACVKEDDEVVLASMGVFFELLWENSDENSKAYILNTIQKNVMWRSFNNLFSFYL